MDATVKETAKQLQGTDKANLLRILPPLISEKRRAIRFSHLNPLLLRPRGTSYLVEMLDVEDHRDITGLDGSKIKILVPERAAPTTKARGDIEPGLEAEFKRGYFPALILRVGNGMILNESMHSTFMPGESTKEELEAMRVNPPDGFEAISEHGALVRSVARHPMVYSPGQVVLVDRLARREVELQGKRYAFVEQVDVLCDLENLEMADLEVNDG